MRTVYEYNGCVFHGHPDCTDEEDRIPFGNLTMREAYKAWETRLEVLRGLNYTVEVKWSCEWLKERKDLDISQFLCNLHLRDPLLPRDAFKGGRTNAARLFYETKPGEKILHYDIVSLYPTVNKKDEYPIDHPEIIVTLLMVSETTMVLCLVKCSLQKDYVIRSCLRLSTTN